MCLINYLKQKLFPDKYEEIKWDIDFLRDISIYNTRALESIKAYVESNLNIAGFSLKTLKDLLITLKLNDSNDFMRISKYTYDCRIDVVCYLLRTLGVKEVMFSLENVLDADDEVSYRLRALSDLGFTLSFVTEGSEAIFVKATCNHDNI